MRATTSSSTTPSCETVYEYPRERCSSQERARAADVLKHEVLTFMLLERHLFTLVAAAEEPLQLASRSAEARGYAVGRGAMQDTWRQRRRSSAKSTQSPHHDPRKAAIGPACTHAVARSRAGRLLSFLLL